MPSSQRTRGAPLGGAVWNGSSFRVGSRQAVLVSRMQTGEVYVAHAHVVQNLGSCTYVPHSARYSCCHLLTGTHTVVMSHL